MKLLIPSILLIIIQISGCSTLPEIDEYTFSTANEENKNKSVLDYSLTELKEIDLTQSNNDIEDSESIWQSITEGYQLDQGVNPRIQREIDFYRTHPKAIPDVLTRAHPYLYMILNEIKKRNMPTEIALLPVIESAFHTRALSSANASGMWQFMAETAHVRGIKNDWWFDGRRDVYVSTNAALDLLQHLHDRLNNDWLLALAGYNWGALSVRKAVQNNKAKGLPTDYWSLKLPSETQRYVPKLLAIAKMIQKPEEYKLSLPDVPNIPYLTRIEIDQQIDLSTAAQMADMSWDEFHRFNAGHKRVTTDPGSSTHVLVPIDKVRTFAISLTKFTPQTQANWISYNINSGDNIESLAARYDTTSSAILKVNNLKQVPQVGQVLLIPVGQKEIEQQTQTTAQTTLAAASSVEAHEQTNKHALIEKKLLTNNHHKITHILKSKQPLGWLSKHYGVSLETLARANNITAKTVLRVGQSIIIPLKKVIRIDAKKGDTWTNIAKRNAMPTYLLLEFNNAKEKDHIKLGQIINVPILR